MSIQTMARRYASALADVVMKNGKAREVQTELTAWGEMMQANPQLLEVLRNPTIPFEQKRRVINSLIERSRVRPTTANFLQVLLQNQRLADLTEINKNFAQELDRRAGTVSAQVTTARPVSASEQQALHAKLSELTRSNVRLQFAVDEELIGGVVTRVGSTIYDGSVRNHLEQVKTRMAGEQH